MLEISFPSIIFTIINVLIIYLCLKKWLFKPVDNILAKRKAEADSQLADAAATQKEADEMKEKYTTFVNGMDKEKNDRIEEARKSADEEYQKIVDKANEEARQIKKDASDSAEADRAKILQQAQDEKTKLLKQAESEIADMVVSAAVKVSAKESDAAFNSSLYNEFLNKAGDEQ
ncbi:MAG: ATP synthase F0 subunit B [Lachnospiraceae bacterium]|jgi:F-type H+-transporting ATPase subunit b|nr:ATP synthase F0 subunit B [Lachnospiraceae bacterium]MEE3461991.1 ATP synthase F0 subunit B [Lachnospiraceae bacterium]